MKFFQSSLVIISILLISIGCSSKTDEEYYKSAENNISEEKYAEALNDFEQIVNEFPESKYASASLLEIGKLYHGKAIKNLTPEQSFNKAVEYYRSVYENHPQKAEAPQALFMSGFILANELKDFEKAKSTYSLFIEKFPDNELSFSAQAELDNLGKAPEEILKEKTSKNK